MARAVAAWRTRNVSILGETALFEDAPLRGVTGMYGMRTHPSCRHVVAWALFGVAGPALAFCPPAVRPVLVGPASDNQCNFSDLQVAINSTTCPQSLLVARGLPSGIAITIQDRTVYLSGTNSCSAAIGRPDSVQTTTRTILSGDNVHPVIKISGNSNVTLSGLSLSGGRGSAQSSVEGGGVSFYGSGSLTLNDVELHHNNSANGGGLNYTGSGQLRLDGVEVHDNVSTGSGGGIDVGTNGSGPVVVTLAENASVVTDIHDNIASSDGGGLYVGSDARLVAIATTPGRILIRDNISGAGGGGIKFTGDGGADIALPGDAIAGNTAQTGGGIGIGGQGTVLRLFSTTPATPTVLSGNTATYNGGGLYLGTGSAGMPNTACVFDSGFDGNRARYAGTAIDIQGFAHLSINPSNDPLCDFQALVALGAHHCNPNALDCNSIESNQALNGSTPTDAATLDIHNNSTSALQNVHWSLNQGGALIRSQTTAASSLTVSQCIADHNTFTGYLIDLTGATASIDSCAFSDDSIGAAYLLKTDKPLTFRRSVVRDAPLLYNPDVVTTLTLQYLVLSSPRVPADSTVYFDDPQFVDHANGNYHLAASSPGLDFAPADGVATARDFDGQQREVELARTNLYGLRDLGPYERQPDGVLDRVFADDFE